MSNDRLPSDISGRWSLPGFPGWVTLVLPVPRIPVIAFLLLFFTLCPAEKDIVFGPRDYFPEKGNSEFRTARFEVRDPQEIFLLRVESIYGHKNRSVDPNQSIRINGTPVFSASDFLKLEDVSEKPVTLLARNTLDVELQRGAGIVISVRRLSIRPFLECVDKNPAGRYEAVFGFKSNAKIPIAVPLGPKNHFHPDPQDRGQAEVFLPGRSPAGGAFAVGFNGEELVWDLLGHAVKASRQFRECKGRPATPRAGDDTASTKINTPVSITVLSNDENPRGFPLSVLRVTQPLHGKTVVNIDGTIAYVPDTGFTGDDAFTYTATDGGFGTDQARVLVQVKNTAGDLPHITASVSPQPNANGWQNRTVTVQFQCSGGTGGISSCSSPIEVGMDGRNQGIKGFVQDQAGNRDSVTVLLNVDKTPPSLLSILSVPPNGFGWNHSGVLVSFQAQDNLSGIDSVSPPESVNAETKAYLVHGFARDKAGNQASASAVLRLDLTPPVLAVVDTSPAPTRGNSRTFRGKAWDALSGLASVSCASVSATLQGDSGFACTVPLADGNNPIPVVAFDSAGLKTQIAVHAIRDTTPPILAISSPANGTFTNADSLKVTGTVDDTSAIVKVMGNPIPVRGGSFTADGIILAPGANRILVEATDVAGNRSQVELPVTLDKVAPELSFLRPAPGARTSQPRPDIALRFHDSLSGVDPASFTISFDGGNRTALFRVAGDSAIQVTPSESDFPQGLNVLTAEIRDRAGNIGRASLQFQVDNVAPHINIVAPAKDTALIGPLVDIHVDISDQGVGLDANSMSLRVDGSDRLSELSRSQGSISGVLSLPPGQHLLAVSAADSLGNHGTDSIRFTLTLPPKTLLIADFQPKSAHSGTVVQVRGRNFKPDASSHAALTLSKMGGGSLDVVLQNLEDAAFSFVVPPGTVTGPLVVSVGSQTATSSENLSVTPNAQFELHAGPDTIKILPGNSAAYQIHLEADSNFTVLADLGVDGLPAGITGAFKSAKLAAGGISVLTLNADSAIGPGIFPITVTASASVEGFDLNRSADVVVQILPITTSFLGRTVVADQSQTPLAGVTVTLIGRDNHGSPTGCHAQTISDEAGNFAFTNLPDLCLGGQIIQYDGLTATSPPGQYAGVDLHYNIRKDTVVGSPILIHLPRIDDKEKVMVRQNWPQDQTFTLKTIANFSITVYAGTTLTLPGGMRPDPFPLIAVEVPTDRLPDEMAPSDSIIPFIVAFQPASTVASQPVAVTFPNLLHTAPSTRMPLMTLDPTKGIMNMYGTGRVAADGLQVIPDFDPAYPGHRYGLVNFDWHGSAPPKDTNAPCNVCPCAKAGPHPIDLSSGLEEYQVTDVSLNGSLMPIQIVRSYRTLSLNDGPFGRGGFHNYELRLVPTNPNDVQVVDLILPEGSRIPFSRRPDGTLVNSDVPSYRGAVMRTFPDQHAELRMKNGTLFSLRMIGQRILACTLESITDANGNQIKLVRDPSDSRTIQELIDPVGRKLQFSYDGQAHITQITDPIGRIVRYAYSGGNLVSMTDQEGGITRYEYDGSDRLIRIIDPRGITVMQNAYGFQGMATQQIQADGGVWRVRYYSMGREIGSTAYCNELGSAAAPMNSVVVSAPNKSAASPGSSLPPCKPWTGPIEESVVTDPRGNVTHYRFNSQHFLIAETDALGQTTEYVRESGSNLQVARKGNASCASCGGSSPRDETLTFDSLGNVLTRTDALGRVTKFTYDSVFNKVTSITDAMGGVTRFEYDVSGNLVLSTDANGHSTAYAYGDHGLVAQVKDPMGAVTKFEYDLLGNLSTVVDPLGDSTRMQYDAVSRLIQTTDALGHKNRKEYDGLDRVTRQIDAKGNATTFAYDSVSNMIALTDTKRHTNLFTYDPMNRQISRTTPSGRRETHEYDFAGNLTRYVDRRGFVSTYVYNPLNQLVEEHYYDGVQVVRQYDAFKQLIHVEDSEGGEFSFKYDGVGKKAQVNGPNGEVSYAYDSLNRVVSRTVMAQDPIRYNYDNVGKILSASMPQAAIAMAYNARNQLVSESRLNGVNSDYSYDRAGRLLVINHSNRNGVIRRIEYTSDKTGNRVSKMTDNEQSLSARTAINQFDEENRILKSNSRIFEFDENGNVILERDSIFSRSLIWDSRNRLSSISENGGKPLYMKYDFGRNLIEKTSSSGTEKIINDLFLNVVSKSDYLGTKSLLTGIGIDDHFAVYSSTSVLYPIKDGLGTTVATTNKYGDAEDLFYYSSFGMVEKNNSTYPFQFTGREQMGQDLYYFRARFYSSELGRFLSEDPVKMTGGDNNLFVYSKNNFINMNDPAGTTPNRCCVHNPISCYKNCLDSVPFIGVAVACIYTLMPEEWVPGVQIGAAVCGLPFAICAVKCAVHPCTN